MARKVLIDCDPGIDDAVALCLALFDSRLDFNTITATEGNVSADQANRNVQRIIDQLDPPRYPRVGMASPRDNAPLHDAWMFHGQDGLGQFDLSVSLLHHQHASEKVICDVVRSAPEEVTILALGPLTNIARAIKRDPELPGMVGRLIMMGGSVNCIGNVTPAAEFNMFFDSEAARTVFQSPMTKTLVPLDASRAVSLSLDFVDQLPSPTTRAGQLLHHIIPFLFRAYRQRLGLEGIHLHDAVALIAALHPELFETKEMSADVETAGDLTTGATIFDRREARDSRPNMEVVVGVDANGVIDAILRGLDQAGNQTSS